MSSQFISYGKQCLDDSDIDAVCRVLRSDFLTQGPRVPAFESAVSSYVDARYSIAVNSATSALHIACLSLSLGQGDVMWTTPNTFVASANVGLLCGAEVDFVDIDPKTYNMSADALRAKLIIAKKNNRLPKIVIPVHFAGQSCDMKSIWELSQEFGFSIIEDASHAIGGDYLDGKIGNCKYAQITVFSFHPVKIITTAEGGLATTNSEELADKMKLFRSHGVTRETKFMGESHGPWYYEQVELGLNYRMTEMQAALGVSQMNSIDKFVEIRRKRATEYDNLLKNLEVKLPYQATDSVSAFHLYPIWVNPQIRGAIIQKMLNNKIGVNVHYIPVHTQPYYRKLGFKQGQFPESEKYYAGAMSLPLHPLLSDEDISRVVATLKKSF